LPATKRLSVCQTRPSGSHTLVPSSCGPIRTVPV
jgi:hypothetical protein